MKSTLARVAIILSAVSATQLLLFGTALAHTGEGASTTHVVKQVAVWGLWVVAVFGGLIFVSWILSRVRRGEIE